MIQSPKHPRINRERRHVGSLIDMRYELKIDEHASLPLDADSKREPERKGIEYSRCVSSCVRHPGHQNPDRATHVVCALASVSPAILSIVPPDTSKQPDPEGERKKVG